MVISWGSLHWQSLLYSVPSLISYSHRKTGGFARRVSCHLLDFFSLKKYFINTCIISCDRTLHDSCYLDKTEIWGPTSNLYTVLFCFSLFSSQRGSIYCCPLFLKRSVFFFFKGLNISNVKSVDTSLESLLSLFSSHGILNLSAVDNRKPNSLLLCCLNCVRKLQNVVLLSHG